jgi:hypothetical protein
MGGFRLLKNAYIRLNINVAFNVHRGRDHMGDVHGMHAPRCSRPQGYLSRNDQKAFSNWGMRKIQNVVWYCSRHHGMGIDCASVKEGSQQISVLVDFVISGSKFKLESENEVYFLAGFHFI